MTSPYLNRPLRREAEARTQWRCTLTLIGADISAEGAASEPYQAFLAAFAVLDNSRAYHAAREKYPGCWWAFRYLNDTALIACAYLARGGYCLAEEKGPHHAIKLERIEI